MGKREKDRKSRVTKEEHEEIETLGHSFVFSDSDDAEANEDLSLKIVKKAMSRASHAAAARDSAVAAGEDCVSTGVGDLRSGKKKSKKEKKKKSKKIEAAIETVNVVKEEPDVGLTELMSVVDASEPVAVDNPKSDNAILRRLLRGPRYFDPPGSSWGACFNCGEEGHSAVNCTLAKRKKPCFICGSFEHEAKKCEKGQDCYICKRGGHRAKDCPKKFKKCSSSTELCLKCGAYGHAMSSCNNDYSRDDLMEVQCYVCKSSGHLCCVNYLSNIPTETSCYKCGLAGHTGPDCRGSRGESASASTPSTCFKCGEEGHFARECTNSKGRKRNREFSTPTKKLSKEFKSRRDFASAPQDHGKARKKKKMQFGDKTPVTSSKLKHRGGWIMDDPGNFPRMKGNTNGWRSPATPQQYYDNNLSPFHSRSHLHGSNSPATPIDRKHWIPSFTSGSSSHVSSSRYSKNSKFNSGAPSWQASGSHYLHRFSASRFGNSSSDGYRRDYDRW